MAGHRVASVLLAGVVLLAACSDDDPPDSGAVTTADSSTTTSGGDSSATTLPDDGTGSDDDAATTDDSTAEPSTTAAPSTAPASTGALIGDWTADTGDILAVLTTPFGGSAPACSGPYVISFGEDGSFSAAIDTTCVVGDIEAVGNIGSTGTYTDDGTTFQVVDAVSEGSMMIGGVATPLPIVDGLTEPFGVPADYTITGDVLSFTFTSPDGIEYTLEFSRTA